MALTDAERKLLDELEATLTAQDPKLVSKFAKPHRRIHPTKTIGGVIGFLLGLVGLVAGMSSFWWISVIGFVVMLVSTILVISGYSKLPEQTRGPAPVPAGESFMSRMEKRWQDRQDQ
ncbi:MAG: DUF3040 domain-containing protein [Propionibacteriaceae bacterium]|nr:DUF3040 domain-containing protein [Propionibacteriaceae bacterium]